MVLIGKILNVSEVINFSNPVQMPGELVLTALVSDDT